MFTKFVKSNTVLKKRDEVNGLCSEADSLLDELIKLKMGNDIYLMARYDTILESINTELTEDLSKDVGFSKLRIGMIRDQYTRETDKLGISLKEFLTASTVISGGAALVVGGRLLLAMRTVILESQGLGTVLSGGAVLTKALAYLGGGSIAEGGKGMVGGLKVLGTYGIVGIVIGGLGWYLYDLNKNYTILNKLNVLKTEVSKDIENIKSMRSKELRRKKAVNELSKLISDTGSVISGKEEEVIAIIKSLSM